MYICSMSNNDILALYGLSNHQIAAELGVRFRRYRTQLGLTRKDISEQSGISAITIARFESGSSSISLGNLLALLRCIQRLEAIEELIPDLPDSLYGRNRR